jgi:DNA-binding transcriptional MerR regulator
MMRICAEIRNPMKLIECARAAGVSADALRYYVREGLVQPDGRTAAGYRTFSASAVARTRFIRSALALGFSLKDVAELIAMSDKGELPCPRARALLEEHIEKRREQLDATQRLYKRMKQAVRQWRLQPDGVPDGHSVCGLIEGTLLDAQAVLPPAGLSRGGKP